MTENFDDFFIQIKILGEGNFGKVILAKTKEKYEKLPEESFIAVKLIELDSKTKETIIKDTKKEIDILKDISSIDKGCNLGIVCYYDSFLVKKDELEYYAIVMEYIQGYSLYDLIESLPKSFEEIFLPIAFTFTYTYDITSTFSNKQICKFMLHLSKTLKYLHTREIVHKDIKPGNIMLSKSNNAIKYIDFGFSCFTEINHTHECEETAKGTPYYKSPELWLLFSEKFKGSKLQLFEMYRKIDIWALGMVFYKLLFGILPKEIEGVEDEYEISEVVSTQTLSFPKKFNGDHRFLNVIKNMLIKNYETRSSIDEVIEKLSKICVN